MKQTATYKYYALRYEQRPTKGAPTFLLFHAKASEIAAWADVDRLEPDNKTGAQRPLRDLKLNKVARFLDKDARNTIPTAIIVALDSKQVSFVGHSKKNNDPHGELEITAKASQKPGLIIDGQHRVFGALKHSGATQLNIVAFLGGDDAERAFQFVVINNSATRVSKDHIQALNLSYDKATLNKRLLDSAGVSLGITDAKFEDFLLINGAPPFKGLISWPTNEGGFIAANAIEGALAELRDRAAYLGIEELERDFFLSVWTIVQSIYPSAWVEGTKSKPNHLLEKAAIVALTKYVSESLVAAQRVGDELLDFTNEKTLDVYVRKVIERIPLEFWTAEWEVKALDTSAGADILQNALETIDANKRYNRAWYDRVELISPARLHGQAATPPKKASTKKTKLNKALLRKSKPKDK